MSLVCIASQNGSPGATTASLMLAGLWPKAAKKKFFIEADPNGGSLAATYQLNLDPGLTSFAKAIDAGTTPGRLWAHTQVLPGATQAVISPMAGAEVCSALTSSGSRMGLWLDDLGEIDVFADVGNLYDDSPALRMVSSATSLLVVARPVADQLDTGASRMRELEKTVPKLGWVLIGESPYSAFEVEATYGFPVLSVLADDQQTAVEMERGAQVSQLAESALFKTGKKLVLSLERELAKGKWAPIELQRGVAATSDQTMNWSDTEVSGPASTEQFEESGNAEITQRIPTAQFLEHRRAMEASNLKSSKEAVAQESPAATYEGVSSSDTSEETSPPPNSLPMPTLTSDVPAFPEPLKLPADGDVGPGELRQPPKMPSVEPATKSGEGLVSESDDVGDEVVSGAPAKTTSEQGRQYGPGKDIAVANTTSSVGAPTGGNSIPPSGLPPRRRTRQPPPPRFEKISESEKLRLAAERNEESTEED